MCHQNTNNPTENLNNMSNLHIYKKKKSIYTSRYVVNYIPADTNAFQDKCRSMNCTLRIFSLCFINNTQNVLNLRTSSNMTSANKTCKFGLPKNIVKFLINFSSPFLGIMLIYYLLNSY